MKIRMSFAFVILLFSLFLVACGNEGNTTEGSATGNTPAENTTEDAAAESNGESSDPIVIQMANHSPTGHYLHEVNQSFMDRAVELSGGKIEFEYYPGGQLGGINEMSGLVKEGAVDMGYIFPPGASFLPLNTVATLPSLATNPIDGGKVYDQLLDGALKEELEQNNLKKIFSFLNPPNSILTSDTKVESTDDMDGLKLYASGGILSRIPELFGASPVTVDINEVYQSISTGVTDGAAFPMSSAAAYKLNEVNDYLFTGSNFGVVNQFYAINMDTWNSYPEDVQNALLQAGEETTAINAQVMADQVQIATDVFEESGVEITMATTEQHEEILEIMEPLDELWVEDMVGKGVEEEKAVSVLEEFRAITEEVVQSKE